MQTMNLTLPVGPFDWKENPLSEIDFEERVSALRAVMVKMGWGGVIVFGEIHESGLLTYYSNYAPRLNAALVLIPIKGALRVLTLVGGRMVPAGKLTTWIKDVRTASKFNESLREWLEENSSSGPIATASFDLMQAKDYDTISNITEINTAKDATPYLERLSRKKSPAEILMMQANCTILSDVLDAVETQLDKGDSPASLAIIAEKTARNLGAQDARCLYSPDGGRNFLPFQRLSDDRSDPIILYIAIKMRGYWADGFMTFSGRPNETSQNTLMAMIAEVHAGSSVAKLTNIRDKNIKGFEIHPVLLNSIGSGVGVSLGELPHLTTHSQDILETGDVISLKVGIIDGAGRTEFSSAILDVQNSSNRILWKSN
jgi:Xaa-Pro aminopeptidase